MPENKNFAAVFGKYSERDRPARVTFPEVGQGLSGADIYRIETEHGVFCLRGWPAKPPASDRIRGLHRLLAHVRDRGVTQVAVPVAAVDGQTLVDVHDRFWQLEPWMPGRADFSDHPSNSRLRNAMQCLAAWHNAAATFQPEPVEAQWFCQDPHTDSPAVIDRLQFIHRWIGGQLANLSAAMRCSSDDGFREAGERAVRMFGKYSHDVESQLQTAARFRYAIQPCLRDIHEEHVLFTGDVVTGLIDPSACRSDNVSTDSARLLGKWIGTDSRSWDLALDEYTRHKSLTTEELALAHVLNISGLLLSAMRWLERHFLRHEQFARPDRVLAILRNLLDRLEGS